VKRLASDVSRLIGCKKDNSAGHIVRLGNPPGRRLCRMLLSPATVLRAQGPTRHRDSWRRKALREVFKRRAGVDLAA